MRDVVNRLGRIALATIATIERAAESVERLLRAEAEPAPVEVPCEWCLGKVTAGWYTRGDWTYRDDAVEDAGPDEAHAMCDRCAQDCSFDPDDVRARVKLRSECCSSRRTSPNPLDTDCALGCGAHAGQPCEHEARTFFIRVIEVSS